MTTVSYAYESPTANWDERDRADAQSSQALTVPGQPTPAMEIVPTSAEPPWFVQLIEDLHRLLALSDGWAGPGTSAPTNEVTLEALMLLNEIADPKLPKPSVVPTIEGGIQFEWHTRGIDLEVAMLPHGESDAYVFDRERGVETSGWFEDLLEEIQLAVKTISS